MTTPINTQALVSPRNEIAKETLQTEKKHVCPGHNDFFGRFFKAKRAEKKAEEQVAKLNKKDDIENARYTLIEKKDPNGSRSGLFNGLNRIYNVAVKLVYNHKDNSTACPYHPNHKA